MVGPPARARSIADLLTVLRHHASPRHIEISVYRIPESCGKQVGHECVGLKFMALPPDSGAIHSHSGNALIMPVALGSKPKFPLYKLTGQ